MYHIYTIDKRVYGIWLGKMSQSTPSFRPRVSCYRRLLLLRAHHGSIGECVQNSLLV